MEGAPQFPHPAGGPQPPDFQDLPPIRGLLGHWIGWGAPAPFLVTLATEGSKVNPR